MGNQVWLTVFTLGLISFPSHAADGGFPSFKMSNEDCTYELNVKNNLINVSCGRNVTVRIHDKNGVISMTGRKSDSLWFQNGARGGGGLFRPNKTSASFGVNNRASSKLKDSTTILKRMKKKLGFRQKVLNNITTDLRNGDVEVQNDLSRLRDLQAGNALALENVAATLTNQYRFLSMAMLAQNAEMKALISTMNSMIVATQKSVRGSLAVNDQLQEEIVLLNTALQRANISKPEKRKDFCPRHLTAIMPGGEELPVGIAQGTFMKDPIPGGQIWVTYGYSDLNEIAEFDSHRSFTFDTATKKHTLPFFCEGTGHVVYKNCLYCHKVMTNKIVKFNLMEGRWVGELPLPGGAGSHNTYPYESGIFTDVDFAIDELGLWVIYATQTSRGHIVISKLDDLNFVITQSWTTDILKVDVGNAFMICGVLYCVDSFKKVPTFIKYIYDTNNGGKRVLAEGVLPFKNSISTNYAQNYMLDYNPLDEKLYAWNHGRIEIYTLTLEAN